MSTPKTAKVANAVTKFTELDLSSQHITTSNFMEFNIAKFMELVPKQSINVDMTTFARLSPMPVPTYGNADVHNRAYFVPYRTVMDGWDEFINDTVKVDSTGNPILPVVPQIYNSSLVDFFTSVSAADPVTDDGAYDFEVISGGSLDRYRLRPFGKYAYKLLCSLGYRIAFDYDSVGMTHSALPLLSYIKVYYDWYYPTAYVDDARSISLRKWLEFSATDDPEAFSERLVGQEIQDIFSELSRVCYDSDYFVSAWDNPVAPNDGAYSNIQLEDPTINVSGQSLDNNVAGVNGTPTIRSTSTQGIKYLSQFAIDALKSVTDYMKRHQISGARVLDRYLSRWGIQLEAAKLNRSLFIGEKFSKIQFGDVTSTADTTGANLGSYAGKGLVSSRDENFVDFSTDEFGALVIVSTIVPKTAYYQGQDRCTFHISRFDFFTPEMDNLGVQALATRELFVPTRNYNRPDYAGINYENAVFGFVPRYAEYKRGYDNMTGDLVLPSKNVGKEGWTLMRDVSNYFLHPRTENLAYDEIVHSQNFVNGEDANQYNRIFYVTDNAEDKFYVIHNFNITSRFPGRSLYDSYEFKDEDKANKVAIDVNGVHAN